MKLLVCFSASHQQLAEHWLLPSAKAEYDINAIKIQGGADEEDSGFLAPAWTRGVWEKCRAIVDFVQSNEGQVILYADADIAFFGPTKEAIVSAMKDQDVLCHLDDPAGNLCTGLVAMRASSRVGELWMQVTNAVLSQGRDQLAFNRVARSLSGLRWGYLPPGFFGTGTFTGRHWKYGDVFPIPANPFCFHANWCIGTTAKNELLGVASDIILGGRDAILLNNTRCDKEQISLLQKADQPCSAAS